jgi:hypothetical protein
MRIRATFFILIVIPMLAGCDSTFLASESLSSSLEYEGRIEMGETHQGDPAVAGALTIVNTSGEEVALHFGCQPNLQLNVYTLDGQIRWRESSLYDSRDMRDAICPTGNEIRLSPSESREVSKTVRMGTILGDSITEGEYRVTLYLATVGGRSPEIPAGTMRFTHAPGSSAP